MGTDIHLSAEKYVVDEDGKGHWEYVPGPIKDCWSCNGKGYLSLEVRPYMKPENDGKICIWCNIGPEEWDPEDQPYVRRTYVGVPGKTRESWYSSRNYTIFAVLAGVRNGYGFAMVPTFVPLHPITECRGYPDDITPESDGHMSHEHSATWCMLHDVEEYDWDQPIQRFGVIPYEHYKEFKKLGHPPGIIAGGIHGPNIRTITSEEADAFLDGSAEMEVNISYKVSVEYTETLRESAKEFLANMAELRRVCGPEAPIRIIYDFDS